MYWITYSAFSCVDAIFPNTWACSGRAENHVSGWYQKKEYLGQAITVKWMSTVLLVSESGGFLDIPRKLCAKSHRMTNVVSVVSRLINFVRSKGFNHSQFEDFLTDMESEYGNVLCYTEVGWLGRGRMLKCAYDSKSETKLFMEMKVILFLSFAITPRRTTFLYLFPSLHFGSLRVRRRQGGAVLYAQSDRTCTLTPPVNKSENFIRMYFCGYKSHTVHHVPT
jgi:hypothetical protein